MVDSGYADADIDADILTMKISVYNLSRVHPTLFRSCCTEIFDMIVNYLHDILGRL
jgi:hypothetical protein